MDIESEYGSITLIMGYDLGEPMMLTFSEGLDLYSVPSTVMYGLDHPIPQTRAGTRSRLNISPLPPLQVTNLVRDWANS